MINKEDIKINSYLIYKVLQSKILAKVILINNDYFTHNFIIKVNDIKILVLGNLADTDLIDNYNISTAEITEININLKEYKKINPELFI